MIATQTLLDIGDPNDPSDTRPTPRRLAENRTVADLLDEIAELLLHQGANEYRIRAYHRASGTLRQLDVPVRDVMYQQDISGLIALPTIGSSIASLIEQYLRSGHIALLDRLRGEDTAERLFATLPSVGPELSRRIHESLGIETLPELLAAVDDGRLAQIPGIGSKRIELIRECLHHRVRSLDDFNDPSTTDDAAVPVSELLDVDLEYRQLSADDKLPKIAPRKFNPTAEAWLPVLHTHRGNRHYTAVYSNTARAHQLNTTHDWVVIYRDDPQAHGRWTVITSRFGKLRGWRIVRGHEDECARYYIHNDDRKRRAHGVPV